MAAAANLTPILFACVLKLEIAMSLESNPNPVQKVLSTPEISLHQMIVCCRIFIREKIEVEPQFGMYCIICHSLVSTENFEAFGHSFSLRLSAY